MALLSKDHGSGPGHAIGDEAVIRVFDMRIARAESELVA